MRQHVNYRTALIFFTHRRRNRNIDLRVGGCNQPSVPEGSTALTPRDFDPNTYVLKGALNTKQNIMPKDLQNYIRNRQRPFKVAGASCFLTLCCYSHSQAAVIWTYNEVNGDVVGTASGSFPDKSFFATSGCGGASLRRFDSTSAVVNAGTACSSRNVGDLNPLLVFNPRAADSHTGSFGHALGTAGSDILWGAIQLFERGTDVSIFNASVTWNDTNIATLFNNPDFSKTGDTLLAWTAKFSTPDNSISHVVGAISVPEPSSVALCGLGALVLAGRRRR